MSLGSPYKIKIREAHIDFYGHVNNATYLTLFEEARWELITPQGFGFEDIQKSQQGPVILEVNLKFLKEIRLREDISITTELVSYQGKIGKMLQKMIKQDGAVASEALFTFGFFDMQSRKLIEPTPEWKKALGF